MNSTDFNPAKRRVGRGRRRVVSSSPAPPLAGPVLIAAQYASSQLLLVFDRDVNIDAFDGSAIIVLDGPDGFRFVGASAELLDPTSVIVFLGSAGSASGPDVVLDATGGTGIVAVDDGAAWAGASDVALPFGE